MFCDNCGSEIPDDSTFCETCGTKIENTEERIDQVPEKAVEEPQPEKPVIDEKPAEKPQETNTVIQDDRLYDKLCDLEKLFKERIAYDEHKNELFDKLYEDKKRYENDIVASVTDPIILEIIRVIEEIRAQIAKIPYEANQENYDKLVKRLKDIPQRLEDVLYECDVEPYEVAGDEPDTKQQKIVQAVETKDPELAGKIAARLTCGYKKGNRVIKSERINVYKSTKEEK